MRTITQVLIVLLAVWSTMAWVAIVFCLFKSIGNLKPGVHLWRDAPGFGFANPFNHLFVTNNLTDTGLKYRRYLIFATLAFVVPILVTLLLAAVTRQLD